MSRILNRTAGAWLVGVLSLPLAATAQAAEPKTWTSTAPYTCQLPESLGRTATVDVTASVVLPAAQPAGVPTEPAALTLDVRLSPQVAARFAATGLASVESPDPLTVPTTLHRFSAAATGTTGAPALQSTLTVPKASLVSQPGAGAAFTATTTLPGFAPTAAGAVLKHQGFETQLVGRYASGQIAELDDNGIDGGGRDADPTTFHLDCEVAPATPEGVVLAELPAELADTVPPSNPVVKAGQVLFTTGQIIWTPSTDNGEIASYLVYLNGLLVATLPASATSYTFTGLTEDTTYAAKVVAVDKAGNRSSGTTFQFRTIHGDPPPPGQFSITGSTTLKRLAKGSLPLSGSLNGSLDYSTGAYRAALTLGDTSGRLVVLGFIPVTAKLGFVPSGDTTGTLRDGVLRTSSKVRVKVKDVRLFGSVPMGGGENCQTKRLSDLNLTSGPQFDPITGGGVLTGTYAISDLSGCGSLTGLVSPLTSGSGNVIALKLTPR